MEQQDRIAGDEWQAPPPPVSSVSNASRRKAVGLPAILIAAGLGIGGLVFGILQRNQSLISAGAMFIVFGLVLFGLSFIRLPESANGHAMSAVERLTKIFYAPTEVFQSLRHHPRWLLPLLMMSILSAAYLTAFTERLTAKKIVDYTIGKLEQSSFQLPPEAIENSRKTQTQQLTDPVSRIGTAVSGFAGSFLFYALLAAIYSGVVTAMGGSINFWQSLAAVVYAVFPVTVIRYLLNFVLLYAKDPSDIHPIIGQQTLVQDNLGVLVNAADNPVLWVVLSAIGVLSFYGLWLMATGLKNTGERVSSSAAWTATVVVWIIGIIFGVAMAALFPSFIS